MLNLEYVYPLRDFPGDEREHRRKSAESIEVLIRNMQQINGNAFESGGQTITSGGSLTLAHDLTKTPRRVQVILRCATAEFGYAVGDDLFVGVSGVSIVPDGTNLNVRYSSAATVFAALNKTTGAAVNLTNANWNAIFLASV